VVEVHFSSKHLSVFCCQWVAGRRLR